MKTKILPLFAALFLAAGAPFATSAADTTSSDEAAIKKSVADFVGAWNHHDVKAMAAAWSPDADLINPFGRVAKGRTEIEKLFMDEHATVMKGTTYTAGQMDIRMLAPTIAVCEFSGEIANMHDPAGSPMPLFKHHVVIVALKTGGKWWPTIVRPYAYLPASPMPPGKG